MITRSMEQIGSNYFQMVGQFKQLVHNLNLTNEVFTVGQGLFFSRPFNIKAYFALGLYT